MIELIPFVYREKRIGPRTEPLLSLSRRMVCSMVSKRVRAVTDHLAMLRRRSFRILRIALVTCITV